jgi:prepilin signal peptidase PulO-like enzyme (type II secretory pathway)
MLYSIKMGIAFFTMTINPLNLSIIILLALVLIYDIKYFKIPNILVLLIFVISGINVLLSENELIYLIGLFIGFGLFYFLYLLFPKGIGFGDVKLAGAIGLFLGFKLTILAILLSFFSGAIVGLFLIAIGKKTMKDPIPFGPFLAFGAIFSMFFGEYIIDWYMKLLV